MDGQRHLNCTEDEMLNELYRVMFADYLELYKGPGAFTARELRDRWSLGSRWMATKRARKAVERGELVEVMVKRRKADGHGEFTATAWVLKSVYEEWAKDGVGELQEI